MLVESFIDAWEGKRPSRLVLDIDLTDDEVHGRPEGRFFSQLLRPLLRPAPVHHVRALTALLPGLAPATAIPPPAPSPRSTVSSADSDAFRPLVPTDVVH